MSRSCLRSMAWGGAHPDTATRVWIAQSPRIEWNTSGKKLKRLPWLNTETENLQRCHWVPSVLLIYCWIWAPPLRMVYFPMQLTWGKLIFHLQWLSTGDSFWIRDGDVCPLFLFTAVKVLRVTGQNNRLRKSASELMLWGSCWKTRRFSEHEDICWSNPRWSLGWNFQPKHSYFLMASSLSSHT